MRIRDEKNAQTDQYQEIKSPETLDILPFDPGIVRPVEIEEFVPSDFESNVDIRHNYKALPNCLNWSICC